MKDIPIGQVLDCTGVKLLVTSAEGCYGCYFRGDSGCSRNFEIFRITGNCGPFGRSDHLSVIFGVLEDL